MFIIIISSFLSSLYLNKILANLVNALGVGTHENNDTILYIYFVKLPFQDGIYLFISFLYFKIFYNSLLDFKVVFL